MLKKLVNEAKFKLTLTTTGPVLIRSGVATSSQGRNPDMAPVQTFRNGQREVFFPGSSLKGVFRSHVEKIGRTLNEPAICNPFDDSFCGKKYQKQEDFASHEAYANSCPVCRLFGSTAFIGRISIGDAYLVNSAQRYPVELRDGVGIDRFTGGAANRAKFDLEAVSSGVAFETTVYIRNFECWQLGMILQVVRDLEDELIRIGSGTSRGLGGVKGAVEKVEISYPGLPQKEAQEVWGLGKFLASQTPNYNTRADDVLTLTAEPPTTPNGIRLTSVYEGEILAELRDKAGQEFVQRIRQWRAL
ncbi:MAG: CRISPR-associated RAMP protein [Chloroflexi bacterium]|nr:MAG: CRISPR-associated RAMP protein [Chloroflexota bacterium]